MGDDGLQVFQGLRWKQIFCLENFAAERVVASFAIALVGAGVVVRTGSVDGTTLLLVPSSGRSSELTSVALGGGEGASLVSRTGVTEMGVEVMEGGRVETTTRAWEVEMLRFTGRRVAREWGGEGDLLGGLSSMAGCGGVMLVGPLSSSSRPISAGGSPPRHTHVGGWRAADPQSHARGKQLPQHSAASPDFKRIIDMMCGAWGPRPCRPHARHHLLEAWVKTDFSDSHSSMGNTRKILSLSQNMKN
ncbi:hypothetical protein E2C01_010717 [Portunus trituberculatus]|uniref:Uncharacterized protein n=1 Tax=Portunus trituberculatus TaxID=210409 RepID=A0A5B7D968_PORTR|nr:hypothetical protein [Portunus trituberculatus]